MRRPCVLERVVDVGHRGANVSAPARRDRVLVMDTIVGGEGIDQVGAIMTCTMSKEEQRRSSWSRPV